MNFVSVQFLVFFTILVTILKVSKKEVSRQKILLMFSYIFYAYWDYRFLFLLLVQTLSAYLTGVFIKRKNSKCILLCGITIALAVLGFFKYFEFFVDSFCKLLGIKNTIGLGIILPVGISFYTFQAISYMIDVYKGKIEAEVSLWEIALYVGFFPQIMSGPIVKAHEFFPQLKEEHMINAKHLVQAGQIFLLGVVKKFVIADRLGVCVDAVYAAPAAYSWIAILIAVVAYSFQIYCDFSGYSDMAIGIGRALGYNLGRNFNCPYIASNPSEFWRRWHISLSSWFRDYVYFPLGGSRKGLPRTLLNLMAVMLLSGLWHGAAWTFVAWGALHGFGSIFQRIFRSFRESKHKKKNNVVVHVICILTNFVFVSLCWVFFRASSFENAFSVLKGLFTLQSGIQYVYVYAIIYIVICALGHIFVAVCKGGDAEYPNMDFTKFRSWFFLWFVILLTLMFFYAGDTAFIYSQF